MKKGIVGKKIGMTQVFTADGRLLPVTVIQAGPCPVVQKKTVENDGYEAIQVGFDAYAPNRVEKLVNKPIKGHFAKANVAPCRKLRELRLDDCSAYNVGDEVKVDVFAEGDKVDVVGTSKGKGYAGVVKRWNARMQQHSHGVGPVHRSVGSMGANTDPSRVMPGKKMAGHLGAEQVTIQNLQIVKVDAESNMIAIRGAIPGPKGGVVYIKNTVKLNRVKNTQAQGVSSNPQKASARR